ncbi:hypothetical protein CRYUN_Cryun23aG0000300 [Craigia yunnanensis]
MTEKRKWRNESKELLASLCGIEPLAFNDWLGILESENGAANEGGTGGPCAESESCNRVAANQWLVQFQQTEAACEVATSILTFDHKPFLSNFEVEFFAAQILKRKIQNEGYYLQLGVKNALRNALLVAAKRFILGPPQLLSLTPMVIEFLLQQSENKFEGGMQLKESNRKILRCLLSWVRARCFSEIPEGSLPTHPLLNFVFNSLQVSSSFDLAVEVLVELVSHHEV